MCCAKSIAEPQSNRDGAMILLRQEEAREAVLAAPWAMAARAMSSTSSSGRGKCSRLGVGHLEKRKAAKISICMASVTASTTASQNNTLRAAPTLFSHTATPCTDTHMHKKTDHSMVVQIPHMHTVNPSTQLQLTI